MLFASLNAFAQNAISGTVVSANNEPIIGAAIIDVASKDGVITDIDGKYLVYALRSEFVQKQMAKNSCNLLTKNMNVRNCSHLPSL